MNILEAFIFTQTFFALVITFIHSANRKAKLLLPSATMVFILLNLLFFGYRWQMVPIYIFSTVFWLFAIAQYYKKPQEETKAKIRGIKAATAALCCAVFICSLILPVLLPVVNLPEPEGKYGVGTVKLEITDETRGEEFTKDSDDARRMLINAWYPADTSRHEKKATYWDKEGAIGRCYSENAGMGTFWYTHLSKVKTNSVENAQVSQDKTSYPIIIYSHSFYGLSTENTVLFEELASRGYIVFSINHSYETIVSLYPDGDAIKGDLEYIFSIYDTNESQEKKLYDAFQSAQAYENKKAIAFKILSTDNSDTFLIEQRAKDVSFLLDELENMNAGGEIFKSKLDLDKVGMMGWSYGGASTIEAMLTDDRIKAGIDFDGWPYGRQFSSGKSIAQPFMVIRSGGSDETESIISDIIYEKMDGPSYFVTINGASHMNFWDFPLFFKVYRYLGFWDEIDPLLMKDIDASLAAGFFGKYLNGEDVDIQKISEGYVETEYKQKNVE